MITHTQLSLAVALSLTVTSTWAATETTVCEVWRITDGTPLVTSDGRPVLTKQCKTVQKVAATEAPTPTKIEPTASTEVIIESSAEPEPAPESTAQTVATTEPIAEPETAAQASAAIVEEAVIEETAVEKPAQEAAVVVVAEVEVEVEVEPVEETVAEATPEPSLIQYQFRSYQSTILFDTDKSNLDADDIGNLEQLAMASSTGDIVRVHLTGHADSRGTDAYNMSLSKRRIQSVVSFLADLNIMVTSVFARGETDPVLVDGKEDLDLSRRVHIEVKTRTK